MNIFFLDKNPIICASYHHDVHLRKMIVETAQILSTAHHVLNGHLVPPFIYKPTHKNHPSAIWARTTGKNYEFTLNLLEALLSEYSLRFRKIHATAKNGCARSLWTFPKGLATLQPKETITLPPMCMPDKYKTPNASSLDEVVQAYRRYYRYAKQHDKNGKFIGTYTARRPPDWLW